MIRAIVRVSLSLTLAAVLSAPVLADEKKPETPAKPDTKAPAAKPADTQPTDQKPADAKAGDAKPAPDAKPADPNAAGLVPLDLKLPKPAFKGTPTNAPPGSNLEPNRKGPRPPFMVPAGLKNLSAKLPVTASDSEPIVGTLKMVTDGVKDAGEGSYVELGPRKQWVQIDLKEKAELFAIVIWHNHGNARIYHDVVVQVADDADFIENVRTLFNNDHNNSSGLGLGQEKEYWETYEGKLIDAKGAQARYVRLYSNGSTADDQNHYTEVEVWGRPAK